MSDINHTKRGPKPSATPLPGKNPAETNGSTARVLPFKKPKPFSFRQQKLDKVMKIVDLITESSLTHEQLEEIIAEVIKISAEIK